jgi:hypothetical protein
VWPPFIGGEEERRPLNPFPSMENYFWMKPGLHCLCMSPRNRRTKGWQRGAGGGSGDPRGRPSLTRPSRHCLLMVSSGVGLAHSSVGTLPRCFDLMDLFYLFICTNQRREAPFGVFSHVFVYMSCKIIISKYMWNLVNGKCVCFKD